MRRIVKRFLLPFLAVVLLSGCFEGVSYSTTYVLRPYQQSVNQGKYESFSGLKAYAFDADTTNWVVASYDDALAGILRSKRDPSITLNYMAQAGSGPVSDTIPASMNWVQMNLEASSLMVVAVDTQNKLYAYRQQLFPENLPTYYLSVSFQLWRMDYRYIVGAWVCVNDFYAPDRTQSYEYRLTPRVQLADKDESSPLAGVTAYAYAVDTTAWMVASYDDAVAGIITSKKGIDDKKITPDYTAVVDGESLGFSSNDASLMVVAVDPGHRLYAYSQQTLTWHTPYVSSLTFCPWRKVYIYVEAPWRVVDESSKPVPPVEPENPETTSE